MGKGCLCVIPARYGSTRLPGKPLRLLWGRPLIQHVVESAAAVPRIARAIVATDDERIAEAVRDFGGEVAITRDDHVCGSDRAAEVAAGGDWDAVLNLQGDEIGLRPEAIDRVLGELDRVPEAEIATLAVPICGEEDFANPNVVKAVVAAGGRGLYFSRASIPYPADGHRAGPYAHLGIYAYRTDALRRYAEFGPSPLELTEKLEQLRALEAGMRIQVVVGDFPSGRVDTPEDLAALEAEGRP